MLKVSHSLPDIAVLRGGTINFKQSLQEGGEVLTSLSKIGYEPMDVLIDKEGGWTARGYPTDPHTVYTQAHTVIDTTRMHDQEYQVLAKKMKIPLIFGANEQMSLSREDLYRILRQQDIKVPDTFVVRAHDPLKPEIFRDLWTRFHTPLLIRPLYSNPLAPSKIVRMFHELEHVVHEYHQKGIDLHILTYKKTHTTSIAVLPHFREEEIYTPMWVDTFAEEGELPNRLSTIRPHLQAPDFRKEHMSAVAKKVYKALGVSTPICIDFIKHGTAYIVVNIDLTPSLHKESRFMRSLSTTGVETGHYIHECIKKDSYNDLKR